MGIIAASLGTRDVLPLMTAVNPRAGSSGAIVAQTTAGSTMQANTLYVATPALLHHYGISRAVPARRQTSSPPGPVWRTCPA